MQKRIKIKLLRIFDILKSNGPMHVRGIARFTSIHPATVSSIVSRLGHFFETENVELMPEIKVKVIRLKDPNVNIEDVERYIEVKKQIRNV
ncbi:hypothetical protein A3K64_01260 [Candidatus Micrarchaeota archaeon RBG_16_36_9]|nr:MAG: hypothetical protein A3K64_01260 [Candidatus Micrarchaeota archaeon RBG_16_36_9]